MSGALRVITLKDGRRVKEVPEAKGCQGCMFKGDQFRALARPCLRTSIDTPLLKGCGDRRTIYLPVSDQVGYLWRHAGTGQTRLVEPDCVITAQPGGWELVGPLLLGQPEMVKREPLTIPPCNVASVGFRFDAATQRHIPQVLLEFEPAPASNPNAKGWDDRDGMVDLLRHLANSIGKQNKGRQS